MLPRNFLHFTDLDVLVQVISHTKYVCCYMCVCLFACFIISYNNDDTMQISHGFGRIALYGGSVAETNRHEFTDNNVVF